MSLDPGRFTCRVELLRRRDDGGDGHGNRLGSWAEPVVLGRRWAAFRPNFGSEQIKAGRLESGLVGVVTLASEALTRGLAASDRIRFIVAPYADLVVDIVSPVPSPAGDEISFTVVQATN